MFSSDLCTLLLRCNLDLWRLFWYDTQPGSLGSGDVDGVSLGSSRLVYLNWVGEVDDIRFI